MDPLSITASIIAVVQVSHALLLCCHRLRGKIQGADEQISLIIQEVDGLADTFEELRDIFESLSSDESRVARLSFDETDKPHTFELALATCDKILSELSQKLIPFSKPGLRSRLKWPFESERIGDKLKQLEKQKGTLQLMLAALQTRFAVSTDARLDDMENAIHGVGSSVIRQGDRVVDAVDQLKREKTRRAILSWLKTSDPEQNHKTSRAKHEPETSQWLFDNETFGSWKSANGQSLWIHGIPGSGKTILSSTIIDHLRAGCKQDVPVRVIYYYFDFSDTQKQTVLAFLQSTVYQLILYDDVIIPESVLELFQKCKDGAEQPKIDDLVEVLIVEASSSSKTYMVIDALDECDPEQRELFCDAVMGSSLPTAISIAITSRKETDIESALKHVATQVIPLQAADVDADVRTHVSNVISRDKGLSRWKPAIQDEILEALTAGSHGMFRWAVCQLDAIKKCLTPAMVRAELQSMPRTLHQTYDRILLAVDEMHQPFVQSALRWLAFASRPLTLEELSEACVIDAESEKFDGELSRLNDERRILALCGALVTSSHVTYTVYADDWVAEKAEIEEWHALHNQSSRELTIVSLSHYSVKEYILSDVPTPTPSLRAYHISTSLAHAYLAAACLLYLVDFNGGKWAGEFDFETDRLLAYSARHWVDHWRLSSHEDESSMVRRLFRRMFDPNNRGPHSNWLNIWNPDIERNHISSPPWQYHRRRYAHGSNLRRSVENTEQPLYNAAALGDLTLCRELVLNGGNEIGKSEGHFESPLGVAAFHGHVDVVEFFLGQGADPNLKGSATGSVLQVAAAGGNVAVVEKLIAAGADVNARGGEFNTALVAAASGENDDVVALLIKHGADITVGSGTHGSSLYQAAKKGDHKMVIMLMGAGADINEVGEAEGTPLYGAASSGSLAVIQTLLRRGADVNKGAARGEFGYPVVAAAKHGHTAALRALIKAGANLNGPVMGHRGVSALEAAIESRHLPTFTAVFEAGASPNILGRLYKNAFHAAIYTGSLDMAKTLLEKGAEVEDHGFLEAVERYGQDPWFLEEILRSRKPDVNAYMSQSAGSAMHVAIKKGGEEAARRVLQMNPYLDAVSDDGSILAAAIDRGKFDLAKELLVRGAGVHGIVKKGKLRCLPFDLAVQQACESFSTELMELLLQHDADVNTGPTAAVRAVRYNNDNDDTDANAIAVIKYLVGKGASLETHDLGDDCSPLQMAASAAKITLVRALLAMGADPNGLPGESGYTLHYALRSGNKGVVDAVLGNGVAVDDSVPDQSLLAIAIRTGLSDLVPMLLEKGAGLSHTEGGNSPLAAAFKKKEKGLVKLLRDHGATFLATDSDVLCATIDENDLDGVRELLEWGVDPNVRSNYMFPLEVAAKSGRTDIMELLLNSGADLNGKGLDSPGPLSAAVSADNVETVRFLLDHGADPNYRNKGWRYAMGEAIGNERMTELLLSYGGDVRAHDGEIFGQAIWGGKAILKQLLAVKPPLTQAERVRFLSRALQRAAYYCKHEACTWLLEEGARVNERGPPHGSPLQAAFANEQIYRPVETNNRKLIIELLLDRGANVNPPPLARPLPDPDDKDAIRARHKYGATYPPPLVLALMNASSEMAAMLLDAGADVNLCGGGGTAVAPLQTAARYDHANVLAVLDRGANVNGIDDGKFGSALHAAAFAHRADVVKLLLERGADVGLQVGRYGSALQAAAKLDSVSSGSWTAGRQSVETLRLLVEVGGADVNAGGGRYGSALQMAAKSGNLEGVKYLLAKGADVHVKGGKWRSVKGAAVRKERWNVVSYLWRLYGRDEYEAA